MKVGNLTRTHRGKVRDTYELPPIADGLGSLELLLIIATDRLSTHNVVHESLIPGKGEVLTALSVFWMEQLTQAHIPHHLVASGSGIYKFLPGNRADYPPDLHLRAMIVNKLQMVPVEFIFRRYLTGSLHSAYLKGEDPYGIRLPPELLKMHRFEKLVFTPTDKSETDDPLAWRKVMERQPDAVDLGRRVFLLTEAILKRADITLVDTKFEMGRSKEGVLCIGDEIVTPDSSRFASSGDIKLGEDPFWLDKQVVRDAAEQIWNGGKKVPLAFSDEVLQATALRYLDVFERITGQSLTDFQRCHLA